MTDRKLLTAIFLSVLAVIVTLFILCSSGCVAVPHDNAGISTGDMGLHNEIPVTTTTGRDMTTRLVESSGGGVGLTIIAAILALNNGSVARTLAKRSRGL